MPRQFYLETIEATKKEIIKDLKRVFFLSACNVFYFFIFVVRIDRTRWYRVFKTVQIFHITPHS